MKTKTIILLGVVFLWGFLSANVAGLYFNELEIPFPNFPFDNDVSAPFDFVKESQIEVYDDKIIININDASLSSYASTGSMIPVLNENSNGIRIKPTSEENIHIGDIITFREGAYLIVHRVIEKGADEKGIYFITKGDNNLVNDGKVRFEDIEYITIGVIW